MYVHISTSPKDDNIHHSTFVHGTFACSVLVMSNTDCTSPHPSNSTSASISDIHLQATNSLNRPFSSSLSPSNCATKPSFPASSLNQLKR